MLWFVVYALFGRDLLTGNVNTSPLKVIDSAPQGLIYYLELAGLLSTEKESDGRINCAERGNYLRLFIQNYI